MKCSDCIHYKICQRNDCTYPLAGLAVNSRQAEEICKDFLGKFEVVILDVFRTSSKKKYNIKEK